MKELVTVLQDISAIAFFLLGVMTAMAWARRRDPSLAWLAATIILLALVSSLGSIEALLPFKIPLAGEVGLVGFMASAYTLLRYRDALIPLPLRWHVAAIVGLVAASGSLFVLEAVHAGTKLLIISVLALIAIWVACVSEPIIRFWLVARHRPPVQAWRLRSLSLGFGALMLILLFAIGASLLSRVQDVQVVIELVTIAIVPLLYASFAPPAWLRRQWRSSEEAGLRAFMEQLLLSNDSDALADRAVEWSIRLVGGGSGVLFGESGQSTSSRGLTPNDVLELQGKREGMAPGVNRSTVNGKESKVLMLPIAGLAESGTLLVVAGPFSPDFGAEEINRVQQFMSAFVTALDRHHVLAKLEETNKALRDANRHKSAFLANMSHELRTPLNAIIGFSELMTDPRGQFDEATRRRFNSQILTSGKHLLALINDILDLSKVEAGQMELRLQTVIVDETVDQVVKTVEPLVAKKSITLTAEPAPGVEVLADPGKLKQMLLNLVSNAIKFTAEGGTVSIFTRSAPDAVEISVKDSGIGIDEHEQGEIFQEFHQVDQGPDRKHEGTGLGLALTKRFALMHGGDVRVQSSPGAGSTFTISLPVRGPNAAPAVATPGPQRKPVRGPLVLVVEDDPAAAELLVRHLGTAGYRTELARTGNQALEKARDLQPAAITLDIILPELDGWEVITRLKQDEATSTIPIVVVSVVDNPELGFALGAIDYVVKPLDGKELIRRLDRFGIKHRNGDGQLSVLVVDDEAANLQLLTRALEPAGFRVVTAGGGKEAISIARSQHPDLVLLDLMMPEVDGFDVVKALRADEATRETPVMVLTAANLTEADKQKLNGHVSQVLRRGSSGASDIVGALRRVIAQHSNGHT